MRLLLERNVLATGRGLRSAPPDRFVVEYSEGRVIMSSLIATVKHARYVLGSLTAVLFAAGEGGGF
jgi:hypothetical protein